jgi:hypothetical protein
MQPNDNDILYTQYGPDFLGFIRHLLEALFGDSASYDSVVAFMSSAWQIYSVIAFILSALFIYGIIYSYLRMNQLSDIEAENHALTEKAWKELHGGNQENRRWSEIQKHLYSGTPNDWKLAIIESDIILGEILHKAGYAGQTIGDQLKSASASNFVTLQDAWDAHRIRNRIAHEGSDFVLTQLSAKEAVIKYKRVFKEFGVI